MKNNQRAQSPGEGNHFRRAFAGVPQSKGCCCIVKQSCVHIGCNNNNNPSHQTSEEWQCQWLDGKDKCVGPLLLLPIVLLPHMNGCIPGDAFFHKQLIGVFMPELNESGPQNSVACALKHLGSDVIIWQLSCTCLFHFSSHF